MSGFLKPGAILMAIGNSGRQDDGLGWAFAEALEKKYPEWQSAIHYRYQLQVEDAELISHATQVVFIDAFKGQLPSGFLLEPCHPAADFSFSTHALLPQAILAICRLLYDKKPEAWVLKLEGKEWELQTGLTEAAKNNLEAALDFWAHHA